MNCALCRKLIASVSVSVLETVPLFARTHMTSSIDTEELWFFIEQWFLGVSFSDQTLPYVKRNAIQICYHSAMPFTLDQLMFWRRRRTRRSREIDPDEVLIDSSNVGKFDRDQFEGRLEKPISRTTLYILFGLFVVISGTFIFQAGRMQIVDGDQYRQRSEKNLLRPIPVFAGRGVIFDRNGVELAWNAPSNEISSSTATSSAKLQSSLDFGTENGVARREYATSTGLSHVVGYVQYPSKDSNGFYYQEDFKGVDGSENYFNDELQGGNGSRLVEVDAHGNIISENVVRPPEQGKNINLSIDSGVQSALYRNIQDIADRSGFSAGAGVIMNARTGEVLALTSYPQYDSELMSSKSDPVQVKSALNDKRLLFLDRAVDGLYTPGSIVKPFIATGVLTEHVIDPLTVIVTNGSISITNPYDPTKSTLFRDWKNLGPLNLRQAIAMSSDVYFYTVGGGYKDQKGLGILNIDKYVRMFGFGSSTTGFFSGKAGTIPTPEWKKKTFNEEWYLGDTYHSSIGQYGFQVTPVQVVRALAALANGGTVIDPTIIKDDTVQVNHTITEIPQENMDIVRQGMRLSTTNGTTQLLNVPFTHIAAKSGTAELGTTKTNVNSWIMGFWPYENPKYVFAVTLERGSVHSLVGSAGAMRQTLDWMGENRPEYFK